MSVVDDLRILLQRETKHTSEEIGKATGIHPVNIRQFKAGSRDLPLAQLEALAAMFGGKIIFRKPSKK